jgi:hypothetical protein
MKFRALTDLALVKPKTDAERLESIFHPRWCAADDFYILQAKKQGKDFTFIAGELDRRRVEVEQRFHRLRPVKNIESLLENYGLSDMRYSLDAPAAAE